MPCAMGNCRNESVPSFMSASAIAGLAAKTAVGAMDDAELVSEFANVAHSHISAAVKASKERIKVSAARARERLAFLIPRRPNG
jgi:hypothetical protein